LATGIWSELEPHVAIESLQDLERFIDHATAVAECPTAVSVEAHGSRADLLIGHHLSFVHITPHDPDANPYHVTVGHADERGVDFWLHGCHHTWFDGRHLVSPELAREALREFFRSGGLSNAVEWEEYSA
jgi:hypothetical protein